MPRGKHGKQVRGSKHPRWNDGRMLSDQGYVKIRVGKSHPLADPNGYCYEHKLVWYAAGDTLAPGDTLHHLNGDRTDNRMENLQRMTKEEHNHIHLPERDPKTGRFLRAMDEFLDEDDDATPEEIDADLRAFGYDPDAIGAWGAQIAHRALLREAISDVQHDIWASWMEYLFSVSHMREDGACVIPTEHVQRWKRQIKTPYHELSEQEKDSDREQADKVLARVGRQAAGHLLDGVEHMEIPEGLRI